MKRVRKLHVKVAASFALLLAGVAVGVLFLAPEPKSRPLDVSSGSEARPLEFVPTLVSSATVTNPGFDSANELAVVRDLVTKKDVRALAALAATPPRATELDDKTVNRLRASAVQAIANVGGDDAKHVLKGFVGDASKDLVVRLTAVSALARVGAEPELAYLRDRLQQEPSRILREKIRLTLERKG